MIAPYQPLNVRDMLIDLGMGKFNATMPIETMFMAPATTEASSAPVMILVGHLQDNLNAMGANVGHGGYIDQRTYSALAAIAGPKFLEKSWFETVKAVIAARRANYRFAPDRLPVPLPKKAMGDILDAPFGLPDVPGGLVTYLVGGAILWNVLSKKKRTSP